MNLSQSSPPECLLRLVFMPPKNGREKPTSSQVHPLLEHRQPTPLSPTAHSHENSPQRELVLSCWKSKMSLFELPIFSWPWEKALGRTGGFHPQERCITMKDSAPPSIT